MDMATAATQTKIRRKQTYKSQLEQFWRGHRRLEALFIKFGPCHKKGLEQLAKNVRARRNAE